jgi:hypothetical protein
MATSATPRRTTSTRCSTERAVSRRKTKRRRDAGVFFVSTAVIANEAKQSMLTANRVSMDLLRRYAPRNDGVRS